MCVCIHTQMEMEFIDKIQTVVQLIQQWLPKNKRYKNPLVV